MIIPIEIQSDRIMYVISSEHSKLQGIERHCFVNEVFSGCIFKRQKFDLKNPYMFRYVFSKSTYNEAMKKVNQIEQLQKELDDMVTKVLDK